jgi:hypothetical protein
VLEDRKRSFGNRPFVGLYERSEQILSSNICEVSMPTMDTGSCSLEAYWVSDYSGYSRGGRSLLAVSRNRPGVDQSSVCNCPPLVLRPRARSPLEVQPSMEM